MSAKKNDANNIAIIGASGTGKTTLAVGLYATSTPEFTVSPVGEETRKYIEIRQSTIEDGCWPAATNEADNLDLRLRLHAGGKETGIVFREYMGECMEQPNYIQDVIGVPKAAMILFNPGMPDLKSAERRNMLIGNLKVIAQHLKDNKCTAVAFVVTASDRLASDLAGFRDEFEEYVSEITNHLGTLGLNWKRFDVTVSGELADQSHPKLARGENNTTHKPFLWLMERIHARAARIRTVRIVKWSAAIAAVAFSIYGILWVRCTLLLSKVETEMEALVDRLDKAHTTKDLAAATTNKNALALLQADRLDKVFVAGPGNGERKAALGSRIHDANDLWSVRLLDMNLDNLNAKLKKDPTLLPPGWAKAFDDSLKLSSPTAANAVAELKNLKVKWGSERPTMEKEWQTVGLRKKIDDMINKLTKATTDTAISSQLNASYTFFRAEYRRDYNLVCEDDETNGLLSRLTDARTNALERYCALITKWSVVDKTPPVAGDELKKKLTQDLVGRISEEDFAETERTLLAKQRIARGQWDEYQLPKQTSSHITALKSVGRDPSPALKDSFVYLTSMSNLFPTVVTQAKFAECRDSVLDARKKVLKEYAISIASEWKEDGKRCPEFNERRWNNVLNSAVMDNERKQFDEQIKSLFKKAESKWESHQEMLVDVFLPNTFPQDVSSESDVPAILNAYMNFRNENMDNPHMPRVDAEMCRVSEKWIDVVMKEYNEEFLGNNTVWKDEFNREKRMLAADRIFFKFRRFCTAMNNQLLNGSPIKDTWVASFAKECVDQGGLMRPEVSMTSAFRQKFRMTMIVVNVDFSQAATDVLALSFGIKVRSQEWDGKNGLKGQDKNLVGDYQCRIGRGEGGTDWWIIWKGSEDIFLNPWTDSFFRVNWEEDIDWDLDERGCFFFGIVGDDKYKDSFRKNGCLIHTQYEVGSDKKERVDIKVYGDFVGDSLNEVYRKHRK